jgi:hypothetical protein
LNTRFDALLDESHRHSTTAKPAAGRELTFAEVRRLKEKYG